MTTVSIRDLRTFFLKVVAMLNPGEEVSISKRGKAFARIMLDTLPVDAKPDFAARFGMDARVQPIVTASGRPLSEFLKWRDAER